MGDFAQFFSGKLLIHIFKIEIFSLSIFQYGD